MANHIDTTQGTDAAAELRAAPAALKPTGNRYRLRTVGGVTQSIAAVAGAVALAAVTTVAFLRTRVYVASATVEREVHPLIAQAIGEDWRTLPGLDPAGIRGDVLTPSHVEKAAQAAGAGSQLDAVRLRQQTQIQWVQRSQWIDAVEISVTAATADPARKAVGTLSQEYRERKLAGQKAEAARARELVVEQLSAARTKLERLAATQRMLELEKEMHEIEEQLGSYRAMKARLSAVEQLTQQGPNATGQISRTEAFRQLDELEKQAMRMSLTPGERTELTRRTNQMRKEITNAPHTLPRSTTPAPTTVAVEHKSIERLLEVDGEIARLNERLTQRRDAYSQMAALAGDSRIVASSESLSAEISAVRQHLSTLETRDAKLAATIAATEGEQTIKLTVTPPQVHVQVNRPLFFALLSVGVLGAFATMAGVVTIGAKLDTSLRSIEHASGAIDVPILGIAHSVPLLR